MHMYVTMKKKRMGIWKRTELGVQGRILMEERGGNDGIML